MAAKVEVSSNPQSPEGTDGSVPGDAKSAVRSRLTARSSVANLGHRGKGHSRAGNPYPENSLAAFRQAMSEGAWGIELDVELCADGRLVVMHDDTLERTTNQSGCVSGWTAADLRTRCRLLDGDGHPTGEAPPTLEEAFAAVGPDAVVNVELKVFAPECRTPSTGALELAAATITEIRQLGVLDRTLFSSFDRKAVAAARRFAPEAYVALLLDVRESIESTGGVAQALDLGADAIHPFFAIPDEGIAAARSKGLDVNVWTVNDTTVMRRLIAAGASAIITDEPGRLASLLAETSAHR